MLGWSCMAKRIRLIHDRYLVPWILENFPANTFRFNVRLGRPTKEISAGIPERYKGLAENWGLRCDCLAIWEGKVFIIEAFVRPNEMWKLAQLNAYETAFRQTESYRAYWSLPIQKILLTPATNDLLNTEAKRYGIKIVVYRPKEIEYYLNTLFKWQSTPRGSGIEPTLP